MSPDSVLHMLHRVLKRAGLPKVRFHDLRHTLSQRWPAKRCGREKQISSMLGHYSAGFAGHLRPRHHTDAGIKAAQDHGNILSRAV